MTTIMDVSTLDPQRVATAALQGFFTITGQWGLSGAEQRKLLGDPPEDIFFEWRTEHTASQIDPDTLKRISYILGIHKALCILLPSRRAAFEWVKKSNDAPLFQGQTALSRLLTGHMEDLHEVRAYLDGECGDTMEMEHREFRAVIVIEFDEQDQCYHGHVANFPGIWPFHGATIDELRQAFEQVIDDYYEAHPTFAGMITEADHQAKRDRQAAFSRWFDENPDREVPRSKRFENCRIEPAAPFRDDSIDILTQEFRFTMDELAGLLEVSVGALEASHEEGSTSTLGDRPSWLLHDIHSLMKQARETLGSSEAAAQWIREPIAALNGDAPLSRLTHHDGVKQVDALLDKINEGSP